MGDPDRWNKVVNYMCFVFRIRTCSQVSGGWAVQLPVPTRPDPARSSCFDRTKKTGIKCSLRKEESEILQMLVACRASCPWSAKRVTSKLTNNSPKWIVGAIFQYLPGSFFPKNVSNQAAWNTKDVDIEQENPTGLLILKFQSKNVFFFKCFCNNGKFSIKL